MKHTVILAFVLLVNPYSAIGITPEEVKGAYEDALLKQGFIVGEDSQGVVKKFSDELAAKANDMEGLTLHVDESSGQKEGFCYALFANGKIQRTGNYSQGKQVGVWLSYYADGTLESRCYFNDEGNLEGQQIFYWRNGNVNYVEYYVNGLKDGPKTVYYYNGRTHIHQQWLNGTMHGLSIVYYESGSPKKISVFENGLPSGSVTKFNEDGSIIQ